MDSHNALRALVEEVLREPFHRNWTVQGLGMLRTYIRPGHKTGEYRLHVWDKSLEFPNVSKMHDHPWHFDSYIIAGCVYQHRYLYGTGNATSKEYMRQTILCGEGGGLCGAPEPVYLAQQPQEVYTERDSYKQVATEVHISLPTDGTVTLVKREFLEDNDHAHVFWGMGNEWVTAEPRGATIEEVRDVTSRSLATWF